MPPTTDALPPAMSTRLQSRPLPPTPPPTAPKPNPNPHRKKKRPPKGRREPYPTKKKDQATVPIHTPNGKEEDEEEEDSALVEAATTLATVKIGTGGGLDTSFSDIEDITDVIILSREEKQKQKDIDKRLQQENEDRAEFAVLEYAVEWYVRFEDVMVYKDTAFYTMHGLERIDFPKEYEAMTVRGTQHAALEGKLANLVYVNATLTNHGREKENFRLDGNDIARVWTVKIEKAMRHKHSSRAKKTTVNFKVLVEFFYARTKTGIIPEHMKASMPPTQLQLKAKQTQEKNEQIARLELQQNKRLEEQQLQIIQNQKCAWKSCPNFAGGQCLELNGNHYELLAPHVRTWAQAIASNIATPSRPPQDFHRSAFLKRFKQGGAKTPKGKNKVEEVEEASPNPMLTPVQTPTSTLIDPVAENMKNLINLQMIRMLERLTDSGTPPAVSPSPLLPPLHPASTSVRTRGYSHLPDAPTRASSPVSTSNWDGYIHWICHIQDQPNPRRREAFERAGRILEESFVTIAQIQRLKNPSTDSKVWSDVWDIPSGIRLHLAQSASAYQRFEASSALQGIDQPRRSTSIETTESFIPPSAQPHTSASQAETQDQTQYTSLQGNIYSLDEDLDLNGSEEDDVSDGLPDTSEVEVSQSPTT